LLSSLIGFIVGVSMFGSVTFLPLYLQVVKAPHRQKPACRCCRRWAACSSCGW
jgi:hypothetical protein